MNRFIDNPIVSYQIHKTKPNILSFEEPKWLNTIGLETVITLSQHYIEEKLLRNNRTLYVSSFLYIVFYADNLLTKPTLMKKLITAFVVLSISLTCFAQGGSEPDQNSGDLDNQFYFRFGFSDPIGNYLGFGDIWDEISRFGTSFELGSIFMLNGIPMPDGLRLGVNADYLSTTFHRLTPDAIDERLMVWKLGAKVGLSLSYSPVQSLVFDTYIKAHIPAIALMWVEDYIEDLYIATGGIGIATGINVRYSFLMVGFEFHNGTMRFEDADDPGDYIEIPDGEGGYTDKIPLPTVNFIIGFSF